MTHAGVGPGPVVLDIGGDFGAALLVGEDALVDAEVEIRAHGQAWDGQHVAFHRRCTEAGPVTAAVFPRLRTGVWEARLRNAGSTAPVAAMPVEGGRVTTVVVEWPVPPRPSGSPNF